ALSAGRRDCAGQHEWEARPTLSDGVGDEVELLEPAALVAERRVGTSDEGGVDAWCERGIHELQEVAMLEARGANAPSSPIRRRGERVAPRVRWGKHGQQASWRSPGDQPADRARSRGDGKLFDDLRRCLAKPGHEEVEDRLGIAGR